MALAACSGSAEQARTLPPGTTWQWQLTGELDTSVDVDMYDIDLFRTDSDEIADLKDDGRFVVCYFSAGSVEDWRDDAGDFPAEAIGEPLEGWPDERWLDVRHEGARAVAEARLDLAAGLGCDGVEPDNVDGYANESGFDLGAEDQLDFNRFLAAAAHERGLSVGLKNDLAQIPQLVDEFDWALNEECFDFGECETLLPFIDAGKAVFQVTYVDDPADGPARADEICAEANALDFDALVKEWDLGAFRVACR